METVTITGKGNTLTHTYTHIVRYKVANAVLEFGDI